MSTQSKMFDDKSIQFRILLSRNRCRRSHQAWYSQGTRTCTQGHCLVYSTDASHAHGRDKPTHLLQDAIVRLARFRGRGAPREVYNIVHVFSSEATQRSVGRNFLCSLSSCTRVGFTFPGDNVPQGKRTDETCGCQKCLKVARGGDAGGCIDAAQNSSLSSEDC